MKKRDHKALAAYIRTAADMLELRDWRIELQRDHADDSAAASIRCIYGQKLAKLWVGEDFRDRDPDSAAMRRTIPHVVLRAMLLAAFDMAWPAVARRVRTVAQRPRSSRSSR